MNYRKLGSSGLLVVCVNLFGPCLQAADPAPGSVATSRIIENKLAWVAEGPLAFPELTEDGSTHLAYKDPTVVEADGMWHVIASRVRHVDNKTKYSLIYFGIKDWSRPETAKIVPLLTEFGPSAPHLLYFRPHRKWYVFYGWSDPVAKFSGPAFSTLDSLDRPEAITPPQMCFPALPDSFLPKKKNPRWLDFTVIADDKKAYLFFTNDGGDFMRCATELAEFPFGWSAPVVVMTKPISIIFEGSCTYRLKDQHLYLTIIEGVAPGSITRFYTSFVADRLDGEWRMVASTPEEPFAGLANVKTKDDSAPWSQHISHGELLRANHDETMLLDPANMMFLYQGWDRITRVPGVPLGRSQGYHEIPWHLSLLHLTKP